MWRSAHTPHKMASSTPALPGEPLTYVGANQVRFNERAGQLTLKLLHVDGGHRPRLPRGHIVE